ncbi:mechanosensitive ion channel family protein [Thalassotalea atypica]|uniref:mechanosensitive ion channel family protein n=1 Tax=Thalassotalea atypica TaxID=2054316 RepID=UPI0025735645|nr:mechanosensitive ion channel domain-containing protein [Thalassotalea atypica]
MNDLLIQLLNQLGVPLQYLSLSKTLSGIVLILLASSISYYLVKHRIVALLNSIVTRSKNTWDDLLISHQIFTRIAGLTPSIVILFLVPHLLEDAVSISIFLTTAVKVVMVFQVAHCLSALLNVIQSIYQQKETAKYLPLNASIQVIKLIIYLIATILAISFILDRSPIYLLSGLGALTAVLLLVFQDTIKGLVASIQISANKMLAPGDWVELPQYGADGDVIEIGLNTVKIQNFDRTVTTVPTYALISGSFKNWRDMFKSNGRRIKRSIIIDIGSVCFYRAEDIEPLKEIRLLKPYLEQKQQELNEYAVQNQLATDDKLNHRQLTNIGTFRAYIEAYLKSHAKVQHQMTCMVRQLSATSTGIPLELYFFSNDQNWVNYEGIQADIFDHLYAMAPNFGVRIFQHPTGFDWNRS